MKKLMKRRIHSYLHPTGMDVRGYQDERWPPPPPNASAPADNTRYANPSPAYQPPIKIDQTHGDAIFGVGVSAAAAAYLASPGGPAAAATAGAAVGYVAATGICWGCHRH